MKVFLLNPPFVKNYIRSSRCTWLPISGSNWYPIFLAYCTGLLEKYGHTTMLIDAPVKGVSHVQVVREARNFSADISVVYISTPSLENDIRIAEKIKDETESYVVLVGPWCFDAPEEILNKSVKIDAVVPQEFDYPILDLAQGKAPCEIKGLIWRNKDEIIHNPKREFISSAELDVFPFVTRVYKKHLDIRAYRQASLLYPFIDLFTARGCYWGKCTFCLWPQTIHKGAPYRTRSIENVIEEFKYIKKEMPFVNEIFIQDDTLSSGRVSKIAQAIIRHNLKIAWSGYVRADIDKETLQLMKDSGCRYLHVGYETASQEILNNVKKGITVEQMERFTEDARRAGIQIHGDFVVGFPEETEESIKNTIQWAKKIRIPAYQFSLPIPYPGTALYNWLKRKDYLTPEGEVSYPHLNHEKLSYWKFRAMRSIYFRPAYFKNIFSLIKSFAELKRIVRTAYYVIPNILHPQNRH